MKKQHLYALGAGVVVVCLVAFGAVSLYKHKYVFFQPTQSNLPVAIVEENQEDENEGVQLVVNNLSIPWEIAFLPDNRMLVTERSGDLLEIAQDKLVIPVKGVHHIGEGGLLGLAIHPDFEKNNWIYLYLTTKTDTGLSNRVERYQLINGELLNVATILDGVKGASNHDGGRIAFGPDAMLYVTTGDAENTASAQDTNSLNGKILRVKDDGSIPEDNPFNNAVYSYGHRNPQGITWDADGNLWATEHGKSGLASGFDELNLIKKGGNYGWPTIEGDETKEGLITPITNSGAKETWAPASIAYVNGSLFFTGLRGASLYEAKISAQGELIELKSHFKGEYGRLRAVTLGPDGKLYISTSNTDGRGKPKTNDDRIIKVDPKFLGK